MNTIFHTGFADEAGLALATQIKATRELGWSAIEMRGVEVPGFPTGNLHDIPDAAFDLVLAALGEAGIRVNCLGSALGNWAAKLDAPFEPELASASRAAVRARRLGADFIRVMSYPIGDVDNLRQEERYRRLREFVAIFADTGTAVLHENCSNYGGMSWRHSLELVEQVPGLKLVFDMGNCVGTPDYSLPEPRPLQDALEFYQRTREHIAYVHIKDARFDITASKRIHTFPGEGEGHVREILRDLLATGYTGGLSIEPHLGAGLDAPALSEAENKYQTYVRYGEKLEHLVASLSA